MGRNRDGGLQMGDGGTGGEARWRERLQRWFDQLDAFLVRCYGEADVATGC
ncbi:MAG: hypothetical protein ACREJ8_00170 [Candidatus Methylomirabilales bacterium]